MTRGDSKVKLSSLLDNDGKLTSGIVSNSAHVTRDLRSLSSPLRSISVVQEESEGTSFYQINPPIVRQKSLP